MSVANKVSSFLIHFFLRAALLFSPAIVFARDIYVNNIAGADDNTGITKDNPFRTIKKAVAALKPGDVIHLTNTGSPYKETMLLFNCSGTPDARITVDGGGATLSGSEPLDTTQWEQVGPGLYKNNVLYIARRFNIDVINRYFFLFDGKMNRMGRCLKGKNVSFKQPSELAENEWTFIVGENAFYLKVDPAKKLGACRIENPVRSAGVEVNGTSSYITVRNIVCTHYYNDGFGITNTVKELKFENIQSLYCGDDGISAHAACQYEVDGFISIGNGTGICDTGNSNTSYNNVFIKDCIGVDLYYLNEKPDGNANYTIRNSVIICNAAKPVLLRTEKPEGQLQVTIDNVLFIGKKDGDINIRITGNARADIQHCTFSGLSFMLNAKNVSLAHSVVTGTANSISVYPGTVWQAKDNIYNIDQFTAGSTTYSFAAQNLEAYKSSGLDKTSAWTEKVISSSPSSVNGIKAGADINNMLKGNSIMKKYFKEGFGLLSKQHG